MEFVSLGDGLGGFSGQLDRGDRFGRSVMGLPDLDGDGIPDLAIAARQSGKVTLLSLHSPWLQFAASNNGWDLQCTGGGEAGALGAGFYSL